MSRVVEHLTKKNERMKLTMDRHAVGGEGVNRHSVFSILAHVTLIKIL